MPGEISLPHLDGILLPGSIHFPEHRGTVLSHALLPQCPPGSRWPGQPLPGRVLNGPPPVPPPMLDHYPMERVLEYLLITAFHQHTASPWLSLAPPEYALTGAKNMVFEISAYRGSKSHGSFMISSSRTFYRGILRSISKSPAPVRSKNPFPRNHVLQARLPLRPQGPRSPGQKPRALTKAHCFYFTPGIW